MKHAIALAFALLSALVSIASAQVPVQRTDTGWLSPNALGASELSYPIVVRCPPEECATLVMHCELSYRYTGEVSAHPLAPESATAFGSGSALYWTSLVRGGTFGDAFYGVSAGGGGWERSAAPGAVETFDTTATFTADVMVPAETMPSTPFEIATGMRAGVPVRRVWFTPQFVGSEGWRWDAPLPPGSPWLHVPLVWEAHVQVRMVTLWEWQ